MKILALRCFPEIFPGTILSHGSKMFDELAQYSFKTVWQGL